MVSDVSICNRALRVIGVAPILALGEDSKAGAWAQESYADARDGLLAEYPWNFAIRRAALAASPTPPAWGPARLFPLPADCLRVLAVEGEPEARVEPYRVEGRAIASDATAPLRIRYIARVDDPALFGPLFADALAARLAAEGAFHFTGSTSREEQLRQAYREVAANARRYDAQEGTAEGLVAHDWLESRV